MHIISVLPIRLTTELQSDYERNAEPLGTKLIINL